MDVRSKVWGLPAFFLSVFVAIAAAAGEAGAARPDLSTGAGEFPENALNTGEPGLSSARRCPQNAPYSAPTQPTLGVSGSEGAVYGQTYGENYGGGPGSTIDQSSAVLGQDCVFLPEN